MRILVIFILISITILTFGQEEKWKTALIFVDGKEIRRKDVEAMDTAQFATLTVSENKVIAEVFRKKNKTHIVHFKRKTFIENQKKLIHDLRQELETNAQETKKLKINGVNYKRDDELEKKLLGLKATEIEWIIVRRFTSKKIIQTNVVF